MTSRLTRVITSQYNRFLRQPEDNIIIVMDDNNIMEWYALIICDTEPYKNGEFIFKFTIPNTFPQGPPDVEALTPSGVFELGGGFCISVGSYHSAQWQPSLGLVGFAKQVWNALLFFTYEDSINSIRVMYSPNEVKTQISLESYEYNKKNNIPVMALIDNYCVEHPDFTAVKTLLANRRTHNS